MKTPTTQKLETLKLKKMRAYSKLAGPKKSSRGQGMTEYIIIVAFVAIGAITVVTLFGDSVRALFGSSANALQGEETSVEDLGARNITENDVKRDAGNFNELP